MEIKEILPITFLYHRVETTVKELANYLNVGQQLFAEAVNLGLPITGPVHWHYFGFEGDESKKFTLEIALPVGDVVGEYDGEFHFKRTDSFRVVSAMHAGGWLEIPATYGKLFGFINENKLQPLAINREIYINVDFKNPAANSTEIQIGIA